MPEAVGANDAVSLRIWSHRDADALRSAVAASDAAFRNWLPGVFDDTRDIEGFLVAVRSHFDAGSAYLYAVAVAGEVVGQCSLHPTRANEGVLGYWIRTDRTGAGAATAAVTLLTAEAFARGYDRLELRCDEANVRSAAVAHRAGYAHMQTEDVAGARTATQSGREMVWEHRSSLPQ